MIALLIGFTQLLGIITACRAVMEARTAQGATAWAVALVSFPYIALPLFWIFGQSKFHDYVAARQIDLRKSSPLAWSTG
jgi:cardiolipin synthase A/B